MPEFPLVFAVGDNNSFSIPIDDPEGTNVSVSTSGLPAGLSLQVPGGEMVIQGSPSGPSGGSTPVTFTLTDQDGLSTSYTVDLFIDQFGVSPYRGQLLITEVLYNDTNSGSRPDEFVEFFNAGPDPIDMTNFRLALQNYKNSPTQNGVGAHIFDSFDENSQPSILMPGDRAVQWIWQDGIPAAQPEALRFLSNSFAWSGEIIRDPGDDLWLLDDDLRIIDYVAFNSASPNAIVEAPAAAHGFWVGGTDSHLGGAAAGESISRASGGSDLSSPTCWERTTTGDATCSDVVGQTLDLDSTTRVASPGEPNT